MNSHARKKVVRPLRVRATAAVQRDCGGCRLGQDRTGARLVVERPCRCGKPKLKTNPNRSAAIVGEGALPSVLRTDLSVSNILTHVPVDRDVNLGSGNPAQVRECSFRRLQRGRRGIERLNSFLVIDVVDLSIPLGQITLFRANSRLAFGGRRGLAGTPD
jgi:hypothetical protein